MPTCAQCVRVFDCMTVCAAFVSGHTVVSVCVCESVCERFSLAYTDCVLLLAANREL